MIKIFKQYVFQAQIGLPPIHIKYFCMVIYIWRARDYNNTFLFTLTQDDKRNFFKDKFIKR